MAIRTLNVGFEGSLAPALMWHEGQYVLALDVDDVTGQLYAGGQPIGPNPLATAKHVMITLQPSDVLNLKATPVQLIPSQGDGYAIMPTEIMIQYIFNTTAYGNTGANDVDIYWDNAGGANAIETFSSSNFLDTNVSSITTTSVVTPFVPQTSVNNQPLKVAHVGGSSEFINGDGSVVFHVYYRVVQLV